MQFSLCRGRSNANCFIAFVQCVTAAQSLHVLEELPVVDQITIIEPAQFFGCLVRQPSTHPQSI